MDILVAIQTLWEWGIWLTKKSSHENIKERDGYDSIKQQPIKGKNLQDISQECRCLSFIWSNLISNNDSQYEHDELYNKNLKY
jgi:hypothetical protein